MQRRTTEQGMALLAVVAVLIALVLIATPFAMQMQNARHRAAEEMYSEQANQEVNDLFVRMNLHLLSTAEAVEYDNLASGGTPEYDVPAEFEMPAAILDDVNRTAGGGRLWDVRVEDEQAKVNLNSAPFTVLGNLFGASALVAEIEPDDFQLTVAAGDAFPEKGGLVRVGAELVRYRDRTGNVLRGLERGLDSDEPWNCDAAKWGPGTIVMPAFAFEIASRHFRAEQGRFSAYRNIYEVKTVNELGVTAIDADLLDRAAEYLTCHSGGPVDGRWANPQTIRNSLPSEDSEFGDVLLVDNPRYFGPGTIVRISDGENVDYGLVIDNDGRRIRLGSTTRNDYQMDRARVEALVRHPINVNTASEEVLVACLTNVGLRVRGGDDGAVPADAARELARRIREKPLRGYYEFQELLRKAEKDGVLSRPQSTAIYRNALNPHDSTLAFGTLPFCFRSFDVYTVTATALVRNAAGDETARRSVRRLLAVNPRRSSIAAFETQEELEEQIIASRDAKWWMTFPYNTGGYYEGRNFPASRFTAHVMRNVWPSRSREPGIGDARLVPERYDVPDVFHYDESTYPEGAYLNEGPKSYSVRHASVSLVEDRVQPLAVSFWYHALWQGGEHQYLFDVGEQPFTNRMAIFYDGVTRELVLRVADASLERRAAEVRYPVDGGLFKDRTWYHVAAKVSGSRPGELDLLVDNRSVGRPTYMTRLTQSIAPLDELTELAVEDAESFPDHGALLLRGTNGPEIFEYDSRSGTSFRLREIPWRSKFTSRFHRVPLRDVLAAEFQGNSHEYGAVVELMGYGNPLVSDLTEGGSNVAGDLGEWHMMKVLFEEDVLYIPAPDEGGGGGRSGVGSPGDGFGSLSEGGPSLHLAQAVPGGGEAGAGGGVSVKGIGADRATVVLTLGKDLQAWEAGVVSDDEAFRAFGRRGYAILVAPGPVSLETGVLGGEEIVWYEKSGATLTIQRYQTTKQFPTPAQAHFVPKHTYGDPDAQVHADMGTGSTGIPTALIPISVEGTGGGEYLDVTTDSDLLDRGIDVAYAQMGTEWFRYTYPEEKGGSTVFVYDRPANITRTTFLFRATSLIAEVPADGDMPGDSDDPGAPPDDPPPPEPPAPPPPPDPDNPPPPPGGEDDGGPTGGDTFPPEPPLPDPPGGEDDGGPTGGETVPPPPFDPDNPPPPPGGEDDGGPTGGETNPDEPFDPDNPPAPPGGEDDGGPTGGDTSPPEPPLPPPPGGEDDGGPTGGDTPPPPPDGEDPPPDDPPDPEPDPDSPAGELDPAGRQPSDVPAGSTTTPFSEVQVAIDLNHRGVRSASTSVVVGDTLVGSHDSSTEIRPCAVVVARFQPGHGDRVTLVEGREPSEELVLEHGFFENWWWVAATSNASRRYEASSNAMASILAGSREAAEDSVRMLKFPSGELPTGLGEQVYFGSRYDGAGLSSAYLDEVHFRTDALLSNHRLGDGQLTTNRTGVDGATTDVRIHMPRTSSDPDGLPVFGFPEDGGVLRIDDELISYTGIDTGTGALQGVVRGVLGTKANVHAFDAIVAPVDVVRTAVLQNGLDGTTPEIELNRTEGFSRGGGCVRIDDEVLYYTRIRGNTLLMPRHIPSGSEDFFGQEDAVEGGGIFRGRYGTTAQAHDADQIVYFQPTRFPDRYRERSVDAETSALVFSKRVDGALFKRVSWDEQLPANTDLRILVRFDGGPGWDSGNIYNATEGRVVGGSEAEFRRNPKNFLYQIDEPYEMNRLDVQADRIEIRVAVEYKQGAFDPTGETIADSWKDTPWLKALRIEYIAPETVLFPEQER